MVLQEPEKIVFHVVTDSLNLPAISMWFLLNPTGKATIHIQSVDNFDWLPTKYNAILKEQKSNDPRYTSALNHLRFYLPYIFPALKKIVLFDHDVVVQRDLTGLWSVDMKGKVNAAVETCQGSESSFRPMHMLMNFSDPFLAKRFNANVCTWAFGMNMFDLREWRRLNLTTLYRNYLQLVWVFAVLSLYLHLFHAKMLLDLFGFCYFLKLFISSLKIWLMLSGALAHICCLEYVITWSRIDFT